MDDRRKLDHIEWARNAASMCGGDAGNMNLAGAIITLCNLLDKRKPAKKEHPNG